MSTSDLVRDLKLLEGAIATRDGATRWQPQQRQSNAPRSSKQRRPQLLQSAALKRNISLQLMPSGMERHERNTSWINRKRRNEIDWRVEWVLVSDDCNSKSNLAFSPLSQSAHPHSAPTHVLAELVSERAHESSNLCSLLWNTVHTARLRGSGLRHRLRRFADVLASPDTSQRQQQTERDNTQEIRCAEQDEAHDVSDDCTSVAEGNAAGSSAKRAAPEYSVSFELLKDGSLQRSGLVLGEGESAGTLRDALDGKEVVEFPTIRVRLVRQRKLGK